MPKLNKKKKLQISLFLKGIFCMHKKFTGKSHQVAINTEHHAEPQI